MSALTASMSWIVIPLVLANAPEEWRGTAGFGARSVLHTTQLLRLSEDLPVVIEVVEASDRVEKLLELLDEMVTEGLVTMEKVRIVKYSPGKREVGA